MPGASVGGLVADGGDEEEAAGLGHDLNFLFLPLEERFRERVCVWTIQGRVEVVGQSVIRIDRGVR